MEVWFRNGYKFSSYDFYLFPSTLYLLILYCVTWADILLNGLKVFKNHGASAGASMTHSHSQMMALPIIPPTISTRLDNMKKYYEQTEKCSICEVQSEDLLIDSSVHFISIVPFAASYPFEMWIIPRDHSPHFHDIDREKVCSFSWIYFSYILILICKLLRLSYHYDFLIYRYTLIEFSGIFYITGYTHRSTRSIEVFCWMNFDDLSHTLREKKLATSAGSVKMAKCYNLSWQSS